MTNVLKYLAVVVLTCLLVLFLAQSSAFANDGGAAGGALSSRDEVWRDQKRSRDVPVRIVMPTAATDAALLPVILFSHGLGGSLEGGKIWAAEWAANGYIVVTMQHAGSDEGIWKGKSRVERVAALKNAKTGANLMARLGDVAFVLDEVERRRESDAAWRHADLKRIGMSGHSFGAGTTLGVTGQRLGPFIGQADLRIKAAIAFSPLGNKRMGDIEAQFANIRLPFFSITGDEDGEILGDGTQPEERTRPFQHMPAPDKYLAVFKGGDHMVFGGHNTRHATDRRIQTDVKALTLAFWNAYLKDDAKARDWLKTGAAKTLQAGDKYAFK
ncbi:MAG: dienelactone hydrolase [Betaproteobacteria bacterium]|nr:dienelactone hydrolase [Betaproteobacteria bacterium]